MPESQSWLRNHAPAAVEVEIHADDQRFFRLSRAVAEKGILLGLPLPLAPDRPVTVRFCLPDETDVIAGPGHVVVLGEEDEHEGESGGKGIALHLDESARNRIALYVRGRLAEG